MFVRKQYATAEALAYAKVLQVGMRVSLALLAASRIRLTRMPTWRTLA